MVRTIALAALLLAWALPGTAQEQNIPGVGKVGPVVKAHSGFQFTEGPATDAEGNVYFTDIPSNRIHKIDLTGKLSLFLDNTQGCNGLMFDSKGRLLACQGRAGRVIAIDPSTKNITPVAEKYEGKKFNGPNDITIDRQGGVYFTDPQFGRQPSQDKPGVYYVSPTGTVTRLLEGDRPNGVLLSPDEKTLYVLYTSEKSLTAYPLEQPGKIGVGKHFDAVKYPGDGLTVDTKGNLYITQPGQKMLQIVGPDGKELGQIKIPESPANVCFGGKGMKTLFVTARNSLYTIETEMQGHCVVKVEK